MADDPLNQPKEEKKQTGNELDRIRQLQVKLYNNHNYLKELDEKIQTLTDGEEKDKLNQEYDKFHTLQGILLEEIDKLSRKVVKEIDYLTIPIVPGRPKGRDQKKFDRDVEIRARYEKMLNEGFTHEHIRKELSKEYKVDDIKQIYYSQKDLTK